MALVTAGQNSACDGVAAVVTHLSAHTGDPGGTGTNEATGGSPAYARKAVTWSPAASGQRLSSGALTFDVPAGTYFWIGHWNALTVGTYYGAAPLGGVTPKVATVVASTDVFTAPSHGLANDMRCVVFDVEGGGVPAGLTEGTTYWVVGVSGNTFQLSTTQGGAAVNVTADGFCWFQQSIPETFAAQGQLTIAAGSAAIDGRAA